MADTCCKRQRRELLALVEHDWVDVKAEQRVLVGDGVRADVAERSGLVSGNNDAEVALPANIQPEEVQLWQAACVVGNGLSTDELATVLRAAGALGDGNITAWTELLSYRAFRGTAWFLPHEADAMAYTLLSLPPHLLQAVLTAASDYATGHWYSVTRMPSHRVTHPLPLSLQFAFLAATMNRGELVVDAMHSTPLHLLATFTFPPPGLLSLKVTDCGSRPKAAFYNPDHPRASAAAVARALITHSSLTRLQLTHKTCDESFPWGTRDGFEPCWLFRLASCLHPPALPSLSALIIQVRALPGVCFSVTRLLSRLPHLRTLSISLLHQRPQCKRQETPDMDWGEVEHQREQERFEKRLAEDKERGILSRAVLHAAACPAALTRLTELSITEVRPESRSQAASTSPKCLRERPSATCTADVMLQLLPLLHAPALAVANFTTRDALLSLPRLNAAISHFTALQRLCISTVPCGGSVGGESMLRAAMPPALQALEFSSDEVPSSLATKLALVERLPAACALTSLCLAQLPVARVAATHREGTGRVTTCASLAPVDCEAWGPLLAAVGSLTALQSLTLDVPTTDSSPPAGVLLAAALTMLTGLTELALQTESAVEGSGAGAAAHALRAADMVPALQQLRRLQWLRLCSRAPGGRVCLFDAPLAVLDACSVLGALSRLAVLCPEVAAGDVAAVLPRLRGLRGLDLLCGHFRRPAGVNFEGVNFTVKDPDLLEQFSARAADMNVAVSVQHPVCCPCQPCWEGPPGCCWYMSDWPGAYVDGASSDGEGV